MPYLEPLKISGATYPGVPHAISSDVKSHTFFAKPKSAILISESSESKFNY